MALGALSMLVTVVVLIAPGESCGLVLVLLWMRRCLLVVPGNAGEFGSDWGGS